MKATLRQILGTTAGVLLAASFLGALRMIEPPIDFLLAAGAGLSFGYLTYLLCAPKGEG